MAYEANGSEMYHMRGLYRGNFRLQRFGVRQVCRKGHYLVPFLLGQGGKVPSGKPIGTCQ